jgi:Arc/MetJ-type ribon-helix-helix transcriptional regulator
MESMPKQKVTITVEKALVTWIDEEVKKFRFRNRSHGFEYAVANLMKEEKKE